MENTLLYYKINHPTQEDFGVLAPGANGPMGANSPIMGTNPSNFSHSGKRTIFGANVFIKKDSWFKKPNATKA